VFAADAVGYGESTRMRAEVFTGREPAGAESCSENELCVDHPSVFANRCWKSELSEAGDEEFAI
jgi:hypothetical protein